MQERVTFAFQITFDNPSFYCYAVPFMINHSIGTVVSMYINHIEKTDFAARSVFVQREDRIQAHFLVCFLALLIYRLLEKKLGKKYTCDEILSTLKEYEFADIQGQGFIPIYESIKLTDDLHKVVGFETDYEFITKRKMKEIQKLSKQPPEKY